MKPTEYWSWSLKRLEGRGRYVMRGKYTEAQAMAYFPSQDPQRVDGSKEIRELPETPQEVLAIHPGAWLNNPSTTESGVIPFCERHPPVQRPAP